MKILLGITLASVLAIATVVTAGADGFVKVAPTTPPPTPHSVNPTPYPGTVTPQRQTPPPVVQPAQTPRNSRAARGPQRNR